MGYKEFVKTHEQISFSENLWTQIINNPEKFKRGVEKKSKIIFYEDLYRELPKESQLQAESPEGLASNLKMYFKCEKISYSFVKSYKEFILRQFENGYLWNKITCEKCFEDCYNIVEVIDKDLEHTSVAIHSPKMFEKVKQYYPRYIENKRDMKNILSTYFKKNNTPCHFINDEMEYNDYSTKVINKLFGNDQK